MLIDKCYINGQWCDSDNSEILEIFNPYNDELIGTVPNLSINQVSNAIHDASIAFNAWSKFLPKERAHYLMKLSQAIDENQEEIATIISTETGKPIKESMSEVTYGNEYVKWFAEEAKRIYGDVIPLNNKQQRAFVIKQPVGVIGIITPWNFPFAMILRKLSVALAAGCTVVIKPSEYTPYSALLIAHYANKVGIPVGVINIITGNSSLIGKEFCTNKLVKKISFTGSSRVGKILMEQSSNDLKKLSMELGGNAAFIIFDDADLNLAIKGIKIAKFRNTGQACIAVNRVYISSSIYDEALKKLKEMVMDLKHGDIFNLDTDIGPISTKDGMKKIKYLIEDAVAKGAKIEYGGQANLDNPNIFMPTILSNIKEDAKIYEQEIFGPVLALHKFETEEEVISKVNTSLYGLANYFYSKDASRIWRVAESLESGMIGANTSAISHESCPFGGVKESGFGKEGSKYGIEDYVNIKYICLGI